MIPFEKIFYLSLEISSYLLKWWAMICKLPSYVECVWLSWVSCPSIRKEKMPLKERTFSSHPEVIIGHWDLILSEFLLFIIFIYEIPMSIIYLHSRIRDIGELIMISKCIMVNLALILSLIYNPILILFTWSIIFLMDMEWMLIRWAEVAKPVLSLNNELAANV